MSPESRYCKVVQADDWIFPECLERMVAVAEAHPSVSIVSAYRLEETDVTLDGLPYPSTVVSGREICRRTLLGELYVFGTPTSLLIRSDVDPEPRSVLRRGRVPAALRHGGLLRDPARAGPRVRAPGPDVHAPGRCGAADGLAEAR